VPAGVTALEALRATGRTIPSSCESGTCGTCRVGLVEGEVDHRDLVLSDHERVKSMLVCVSRAYSPELVLDL
jgi:phthalate 4,5-dioxygenase reductase component